MFVYFTSAYKDQANGFVFFIKKLQKKAIDSLTMLSYGQVAMYHSHINIYNFRIFYFTQRETTNSVISYTKSEYLNYATSICLYWHFRDLSFQLDLTSAR